MSIQDLLTQPIVELYTQERFYAEIVLQMDRKIDYNMQAAAGVCIKNSKVQLHINPTLYATKSIKEKIATLKHECQHILNDHIPRSMELAPEVYDKSKTKDHIDMIMNAQKHMCMNIAADASINPGIPDIPETCVFPKHFDLPNGETFEWYLTKLKNNEKMKVITEFDDHSIWAESDTDKEAIKEYLKKMVNDAAKKTRAAGLMTSDNELLVSKLNRATRDWKHDVKRFAARCIEAILEPSRKKRNRRYGIMYPGYMKFERLVIGIGLDTSGSMSDSQINQAMAEIGNIAKYATVIVAEADSEVKNVYEYDPKKTYSVKGRGGTAYKPVLDYFTNKVKVDAVIYLGDMDTADEGELVKPKYPVLWAIFGNQKPPAPWGYSTKVEFKDED